MRIIKTILRVIIGTIYFVIGMLFYYMEIASNWVVGYYRKTEYVRKGKCNKCGVCCDLLGIQYPNFFNYFPWLIRLVTKWHEFRCCFTFLNKDQNYLLYKCNLKRPDGTCGIYHFRPRICRDYPKRKLFGRCWTHFTCGYYFVRRDGQPTFDEALHHANERIVMK